MSFDLTHGETFKGHETSPTCSDVDNSCKLNVFRLNVNAVASTEVHFESAKGKLENARFPYQKPA